MDIKTINAEVHSRLQPKHDAIDLLHDRLNAVLEDMSPFKAIERDIRQQLKTLKKEMFDLQNAHADLNRTQSIRDEDARNAMTTTLLRKFDL